MQTTEIPADLISQTGRFAAEREYSRAVQRLDKGFEWRTVGGFLLATPEVHPPTDKRKYSVTTFTLARRMLLRKKEFFVRTFCQCSKKREQLVLAQMQPHTGLIVMGHVIYVPMEGQPVRAIIEVTGMSIFRAPGKSEAGMLQDLGLIL